MESETISKKVKDFKSNSVPVHLLLKVLDDRFKSRVTQEELTETCYRWSFHYGLEALNFKPLPATPDYVLVFYNKTEKLRKRIWEEDSEQRGRLLAFFSVKQSVIQENIINEGWIKEMLTFFDRKGEVEKVAEIHKVLKTHEGGRNE